MRIRRVGNPNKLKKPLVARRGSASGAKLKPSSTKNKITQKELKAVLKKANVKKKAKAKKQSKDSKKSNANVEQAEQLEIDFGDNFKSKTRRPLVKAPTPKPTPAESCAKTVSNFLSTNRVNIFLNFLKSEYDSAQKQRKFGKRDNVDRIIKHVELIGNKEKEITWAQNQTKRHFQDRQLARELQDDISNYKNEISILKNQVIRSSNLLFKVGYPKNYAANNIENVIMRNHYMSTSNPAFMKVNYIHEK